MLLLFILRKMKFNVVSTKENLVTCWDFHNLDTEMFSSGPLKVFLATLFLHICFYFVCAKKEKENLTLRIVSIFRSSRPGGVRWKGFLRNFAKFTGKHLCRSLFFNTVAALRPATLLKKRLWHRCFHVNFAKFLRTPFPTEYLWRLLLNLMPRNNLFDSKNEVSKGSFTCYRYEQ